MKQYQSATRPVEPPGFERVVLKKIPALLFASVVVPGLFYASFYISLADAPDYESAKTLTSAGIVAIAVAVTLWTALLTLAIGCYTIAVAKGPARYADAYPLSDADKPASDATDRSKFTA